MFEHDIMEWAKQLLKKDQIFIDIGAHIGTYTVRLHDYCQKVYAFEPQKRTFYNLCASLLLNNVHNAHIENCALGSLEEKDRSSTLHIVSEDGGGSNLDNLDKSLNVIRTETVLVKSLDDFDIPSNICLIKIDSEGHELEILLGATETLKRANYPRILFEVSTKEHFRQKKKKLLAYVSKLGYRYLLLKNSHNMYLAFH